MVSEAKAEIMIAASVALHNFDIINGDLVMFNNDHNVNLFLQIDVTPFEMVSVELPTISTRSWLFDLITGDMIK